MEILYIHPAMRISLLWQKHSINKRYFYSLNDGKLLLLRLNNFPDEPFLTLIDGLSILDLDNVPENWVIPFN